MATALSIKQGATLQLLLAVANDDDSPFDLATVSYGGALRTAYGELVATLVLTPTLTAGQLVVQQTTAFWPVGVLSGDLKFTSLTTGIVVKSETFPLTVVAAITP